MKASRTVPVHYLVSVYHPEWVPGLVREVAAAAGERPVPLILHFPSCAFPAVWNRHGEGDGDFAASLSGLAGSGALTFLPAGFSGAPLGYLTGSEAAQEARWAFSNPWKTGFRDLLPGVPGPLIPFWNDPFRPALALDMLAASPAVALGTADLGPWHESLVFRTSEGMEFLPVHRYRPGKGPLLADAFRLYRAARGMPHSPAGRPGLLVRTDWVPGQDIIASLVRLARSVESRGLIPTGTLQTLPSSVLHPIPSPESLAPLLQPWGPGYPVMDPALRQRLRLMATNRTGRSQIPERVRTQILHARPPRLDRPFPAPPGPVLESSDVLPRTQGRGLISAMQGSAVLMADGFDIRFQEGTVRGLDCAGVSIPFSPVTQDILTLDNRTFRWDSEGAIAFESDRTRGLRHTLVLDHPDARMAGRMSLDYVLSDRTPWLILDIAIRHPWFDHDRVLERYLPLGFRMEFPSRPGKLLLSWTDPDGAPASCPMETPPEVLSCTGTAWTLSWTEPDGTPTSLHMRRMPEETGIPAPMTVRTSVKGGKLHVTFHPEGIWNRTDTGHLRGVHHHLALALLPDRGGEIPPLDPLTGKDFPPFCLCVDGGRSGQEV